MKQHKRFSLAWLQSELRAQALKTDDEELHDLFWRMYYKAQNAEREVRELVMEAEIRRLLQFAVQYGLIQDAVEEAQDDENATDAQEKDNETETEFKSSTYIKHNLPRQKRLWD